MKGTFRLKQSNNVQQDTAKACDTHGGRGGLNANIHGSNIKTLFDTNFLPPLSPLF